MYASLGSPVISTLLRTLRKGYFATIPRFTSALLYKHKPNSVASALGHLDRRRQGIDSTTPAPAVVSSSSPVVNLFVRLDAETSADLETFLTDVKKVTFQYFPTGTHSTNRAECCIRTWKNHFISTLATASSVFLEQVDSTR